MDAHIAPRGVACGRNRGDPSGYSRGFGAADRDYLDAESMTPCASVVRRRSLLRPGCPPPRVRATGATRGTR